MQYLNYERDVVLRHGVVLEGWTHSTWANPSELSTSLEPLRKLLDALKNDTCKFTKLTREKLQKRQELYNKNVDSSDIQVWERQKQKDAGQKRKWVGQIDDETDADTSGGDQQTEEENDGPSVKKRKAQAKTAKRSHRQQDSQATGKKRRSKKSAAVINDEDDN